MYLKQRKLPRKRNWDYSWHGTYFITICTKDRINYFGKINKNNMKLNDIGKIAENCWDEIAQHFDDVEPDTFVVMPNHIHFIIHLLPNTEILKDDSTGKEYILSLQNQTTIEKMNQRLPIVIRTYKSAVSRLSRKIESNFACQTSYFDRIIKDEKELQNTRTYIFNNPVHWIADENNI